MPKFDVLITGKSGFIGSYLYNFLADRSLNITSLSLRGKSYPRSSTSLTDVHTIVHLAGPVHNRSLSIQQQISQNKHCVDKLLSSVNLSSVKVFIYISSISVYGSSPSLPVTSSSPLNPVSAYAIGKLSTENYLSKLLPSHVRLIIIRPPAVYGPSSKGSFRLLRAIFKIFPILFFPRTQAARSYVSVSYLAHLIADISSNAVANCPNLILPVDLTLSTEKLLRLFGSYTSTLVLFFPVPRFILHLFSRLGIGKAALDSYFSSFTVCKTRLPDFAVESSRLNRSSFPRLFT